MSGNTSEQSPQLEMHPGFDSQITVNNKHDGNNVRPCAASQRHIRTEQKRRDRINEGFVALQALLPGKEKVEKAIMLTQAADYIKQLQDLMQQVLACGVSKSLPNELQWNLRMLLPRKGDLAPVPAPTNPQSQSSPAPYPGSTSANNNSSTTSTSNGQPVSQAPVAVMNSVAPMVTAPQVQGPPYGLQLSQPQGPQLSGLGSMGMNIAQGQVALSEPAAGGGGMGQGSGGMLIADAATLSQLQALVQQQQAVQGWHNASHLLQALHVQQQLQQSSSGGPVGITVTPQLLQQLNEASHPTQGMPQVMYQPQAPSQVSMGVPVHTNGLPVSHMPAPVGNPTPMMSAAPVPHQGVHHFQAPQPTSSFAPAATSAFSSLPYPHGSSAFTPAGSGHLSGLHQLMEAAHASDEERDGSFEMRSPKRPRCYSTGPPKMAKAGILV